MRKILLLFLFIGSGLFAQSENSTTRDFIEEADFSQINKDWRIKAIFESGIGETLSFFPIEVIDLKTGKSIYALQVEMNIEYVDAFNKKRNYFKTSWVGMDEINEFTEFIEKYIIPNLDLQTESERSTSYHFDAKEMVFEFQIKGKNKRISVYLKDAGIIDTEHYFWTERKIENVKELVPVLNQLKK